MDQVIQIIGALLILVAYAAVQFGALNQRSRVYLVLNLVGSAVSPCSHGERSSGDSC
jgi:hypothetical protein